jgi:parvulin-like peptidyl-prolyl isomerase
MEIILEQPTAQPTQLSLPEIAPVMDAEILAYLRRTCKIAELAASAERDALVLKLCEQLNITLSEQEWQSAGDAFRSEHRLLGASETFAWLNRQRVAVDDWSQGIRVALLTKKLQEHLFGEHVDGHYLNNREQYRRVAVSQILVDELSEALRLVQLLRQGQASFCAIALEYSKGKRSRENGGFVGIRFINELIPEIAAAIAESSAGEIIGPVQTRFGHHILKIEKWFPIEFSEPARDTVLELFFETWLQELASRDRQVSGAIQ